MMHGRHVWIASFATMAMMAVGLSQQPADTILYNGKVLTVDKQFRTAQAVAVRGKQIAAVGSDSDVLKLAGPNTVKIDLQGKTVTPGLIHTHVHLESIGGYSRELPPTKVKEYALNMKGIKGKEDLQQQIRDIIAAFKFPAGQWLSFTTNPRSKNDAHILLDELTATELDKAAPNNPIVLAVGVPKTNLVLINGKAIEVLWKKYGDFIETYGRYWIDASGKPTGIFESPASKLVWSDEEFALDPAAEDIGPYYRKILMETYTSMGVTTLSGSLLNANARVYQWLDSRGEMPLRYAYGVMSAFRPGEDIKQYKMGAGTDTVFISSVSERGVDGAGSRMCVTLPRQLNIPSGGENSGLMGLSTIADWWPRGQCHLDIEYNGGTRGARIKGNYLADWFSEVARDGLRSANAHVSGNDSHRRLIDEWERIDRAKPGAVKGWAMDHCDLIDPKDIPRAAKLGLMWSCNLNSVTDPEIPAVFGEQVSNTYANPIKSMLDAGINVSLEGDWEGVETLITRKDDKGVVRGPAQRLDRATALRVATQNGANYILKGDVLGSIEPGKLADLVILDRDYLTIPEEQISDIRPLMTMLGGKMVFLNTAFSQTHNLKPAGAEISTHEELMKRRPAGSVGGGG